MKKGAVATPEVHLQTGMVTNGPVRVNQPFVWVNTLGVSCSVIAETGEQQWFNPDPVTVPAAANGESGTAAVTAIRAGTFNYVSTCSQQGDNVFGRTLKVMS